jgi:hypothetical protein
MRSLAVTIAALAFFVFAGIGYFNDLGALDCAIRSLVGALAVFFMVTLAGRMVLAILVSAAFKSQDNPKPEKAERDRN